MLHYTILYITVALPRAANEYIGFNFIRWHIILDTSMVIQSRTSLYTFIMYI